jgi:hypothetical protein
MTVLADADIKQEFSALGFAMVGNTPEQFASYEALEFARWRKVTDTETITRGLAAYLLAAD